MKPTDFYFRSICNSNEFQWYRLGARVLPPAPQGCVTRLLWNPAHILHIWGRLRIENGSYWRNRDPIVSNPSWWRAAHNTGECFPIQQWTGDQCVTRNKCVTARAATASPCWSSIKGKIFGLKSINQLTGLEEDLQGLNEYPLPSYWEQFKWPCEEK